MALYVLNQKRRELTRIEAEHGMDIDFDPTDGLAAGTFEIDRTRTRDPADRPRNHSVSIEAGFVPSDEPEPEIAEEVGEEIVEDAEESEASQDDEAAPERSESDRRQEGEGEREGGRRRRRRGGRGRNRERRPRRPQVRIKLPSEARPPRSSASRRRPRANPARRKPASTTAMVWPACPERSGA